MKYLFIIFISIFSYVAHAKDDPAQTKREILQHRAIAQAHEIAAKCLESGKDEEICNAELGKACKGIAIGKMCGMKHVHEQ